MSFGLQSDLPDRVLPSALRMLLAQQTEALETFLECSQNSADTIRANENLTAQEKVQHLAALAHETSERLHTLEHKNVRLSDKLVGFRRC